MSEAGEKFPKWDFRRILVHYYTGIEFAGPISPDPPELLRANMLQIEGLDPHDGLTMCKGEQRTGLRVLYQNTGRSAWPLNEAGFQGVCLRPMETENTLVGHHLSRQDGVIPCGNCVGPRRVPICRPVSPFRLEPGESRWVNSVEIFIPDDPAINGLDRDRQNYPKGINPP